MLIAKACDEKAFDLKSFVITNCNQMDIFYNDFVAIRQKLFAEWQKKMSKIRGNRVDQ